MPQPRRNRTLAALLFNMFELVSHHGWKKPGLTGLIAAVWSIVRDSAGLLALLAMGLAANLIPARGQPGKAYYPWHPLASLLAEGKLYHFEYGLIDRYMGGSEASQDHFRANLPPRLRWVASRARGWSLTHYVADFSEDTQLPELPGWIVRERPNGR